MYPDGRSPRDVRVAMFGSPILLSRSTLACLAFFARVFRQSRAVNQGSRFNHAMNSDRVR